MRFFDLTQSDMARGTSPLSLLGAGRFEASAEDGSIHLIAPAKSDWFHDPKTRDRKQDAPMLLTEIDGLATLRAYAKPRLESTFDAAVLMVHESDDAWAKLCLEMAPDGRVLVVSVVTRGDSDDANAFEVDTDGIHLRVSHLGGAYAFHASRDAKHWDLIRYFTLGAQAQPKVGLGAQSPLGGGCTAQFTEAYLEEGAVGDIRDGQ